jgi:environmental stress-induced protein Ves
MLNVPVTSHNAALAGALVSLVTKGGIEVTVEGKAVVKFLMITKTFPFARTVPVSTALIAGMVTGQKKKE